MLLGTLGVSLIGNMLAGKGVQKAGKGSARQKKNMLIWIT